MTQMIDAIFEGGVFRPLSPLDLAEHAQVRLTFETAPPAKERGEAKFKDPLEGLIFDAGIADFAENHDDYRAGWKKP